MLNYIARRLGLTVIVLFVVSIFSFSLIHIMPGDPVAAMLGESATVDEVEALRKELHLDKPFLVQYGYWLSDFAQGELGKSLTFRVPVADVIAERLPRTLYLSFLALILSVVLGISAGIYCAIRRGGIIDQLVSVLANIGIAVPGFWLALLGVYIFGFKLGWLPIQGYTSPLEDLGKSLYQAILPVIMLAVPGIALLARQTRSSMLEVIRQDYIRTAWSKGLKERQVVLKHALKNALVPIVTLLGLQLRVLVGGTVMIESVFNIPGMGRTLVEAAYGKDFLVVQAGVLLMAVVVSLANLIADITNGWLEPRTRYE